jgi:hypothetical protein
MVRFTRVKDPERAKDGDIVLFPAGERRLNVSGPTFAKMGLSIGGTSRSDNSRNIVAKWLVRKDMVARAFMVCNVCHRDAPTENELLLGMDAVAKRTKEDPEVRTASIVPFGPKLWTMREWAGCWNETHDGAVQKRLLETMGLAGTLHFEHTRGPKSTDDLYANQVWDGFRLCSMRPDGSDDADAYFPTRQDEKPDMDTYACETLMAWDGCGWNEKEQRIRFNGGFLAELVKRGAVVLRPTQQFVDDMTGRIAGWASAKLAQRFFDRIQASRRYMKGLMADVKRDITRLKAYRANARKMAPEETRSRRTMLAETGVEL